MEIPFYCSFNDFQNNYENDLKNFLKIFEDATEKDYLKEVLKIYKSFLNAGQNHVIEEISCDYIMEDYPEYAELNLNSYTEIMQEKLKIYCSIRGFYDNEKKFHEDVEILDYWENCNIRTKENKLVITDDRHKYYRQFYNSFFDNIALDELKYDNFTFSIFKILDFINNKTNKIEPEIIQPENNIELTKDQKKRFTTPINIAILKELGVFGIMAKKGFNRKSIIDTLYQITGANSKNLEKYYDSMVKNDNIEFNNTHTKKAKEFLNSKGY
ncbi:hypothetical protein [Cloacibacterium sp. TD35]|uniref:hypothetical protein n=1 Tax=Cloacibacterium sp. TD35 TaxID=2976818 RepID=UPI00237DB626|nr:hypothetical protein [Cloacibacterium sp. TD35]WDT68311.1 hypothetical protein N7277_01515 [Cloacibacterium sp. TD35]